MTEDSISVVKLCCLKVQHFDLVSALYEVGHMAAVIISKIDIKKSVGLAF